MKIAAFLETAAAGIPVLDVRSPGEFAQGHIPGAKNMPLFDDIERAEVGTLYKQVGPQEALEHGLEIVGPKLVGFVRTGRAEAHEGKILVHCWRGGMRSSSVANLLRTAGLQVDTLDGGYKAFRRHVLDLLARPMPLVMLGGETGSGKTDILRELAALGEQTIDLEGQAHHRGSAFGALGESAQPSSEQFENDLYPTLSRLDFSRRVWVEDESRNIGQVFLDQRFWEQMQAAPIVRLQMPFELRVQRLVADYGHFRPDELAASLHRIAKRLGGLALQTALEALDNGALDKVARIALHYYDKAYQRGINDKPAECVHNFPTDTSDPKANAARLLAFADALSGKK